MKSGFHRAPHFFDVEKLLAELNLNGNLKFDDYNDFLVQEDSAIYELIKFHQKTYALALPDDTARVEKKYRQYSFSTIKSSPANIEILKRRESLLFEMENVTLIENRVGPYLKEILSKLPPALGRIRLAVMLPHSNIQPHVDHGARSLMRLHLPLITNKECQFFQKAGSHIHARHLPADGSLFTFNVGRRHWVNNESSAARLHLIIDCFDLSQWSNFEVF